MKLYQKKKDKVWEKGTQIKNKDPNLYRLDKCNNLMYYHSYGKNSALGWSIDHSLPTSKGGSDHLNNLQPMNSRQNIRKGNSYPYKCEKDNDFDFPSGVGLLLLGALIFKR